MNETGKGKQWLLTGGVVGLLAVVFGAFGAHGIEEVIPKWYDKSDLPETNPSIDPDNQSNTTSPTRSEVPEWYQLDQLHQKKLKTWITGVRYHFYHTIPILIIGIALLSGKAEGSRIFNFSALLFVAGIAGFSGSIYLYVITKIKIFGMTAALGGVILVSGWLFFVLGVVKSIPREKQPNL